MTSKFNHCRSKRIFIFISFKYIAGKVNGKGLKSLKVT